LNELRFDDLLRSFAAGLSRRATLVALASGIFGAGSRALLDDAEARRKRKRKKKRKKCKGGTKKCGKKCIPSTSCCTSADCGANGSCVGNACDCNSGFKACNGTCIPVDDCCGGCPGDTVCSSGECVCPFDCCNTSECPSPTECREGICLCPGADAINCFGGSDKLCCDGNTEVCAFEEVGDEFVPSCQAGGCPATNFCADAATEQFVCANDLERICVCTDTADPIAGHACVDLVSLDACSGEECETSSQCGAGRVCVVGDPGCGCDFNYCVDLCPEVASNRAKRGAGGTPVDLEAFKGGVRKRRR
jgi:hypothetical protein